MLDKVSGPDYTKWCHSCAGVCNDIGKNYGHLRPGSVVINRHNGGSPPVIGIITRWPERQFNHVFMDILVDHRGTSITGLSARYTTLIPMTPDEAANIGLLSPKLVDYCAEHGHLFIGPHQRWDIGSLEWKLRRNKLSWRCVETHTGYKEP